MNLKTISRVVAALWLLFMPVVARAQATLLPPGEQCFQATAGINGMVGLLGTITGGSLYTNGTYGGVVLTGGSGSSATANITVSGAVVTSVTILNPGSQYVAGDVLSAAAANIGGTGSGFSVPVSSTSVNSSLAGGTVGYYIPNTLTLKQTWQNSGQTVLNTNPVNLDANGCAVVYGAGIYRQILKDSLGNTVWDKLTASTSGGGIFWAGQAGGTGNAITITDTAFANQDGATIQFLAKAVNTGATTISVSGGAAITVVQDTSTGPASLIAGQIGPGNTPIVTYDATNAVFHLINPSASSSTTSSTSIVTPQGYLNLVGQATGDVIQTTDVTAATTIFYSPYVGSVLPIWNGANFIATSFSELTATLTAAGSTSSTIQDACVFSNNGVPTLAIGPSWQTVTAGAGARGTGVGSAQLTKLQGIWVNSTQIIGYNGLSSFTIPANQCTYVGSLSIDASAGQVSAYVTAGQSRKFGVWNAYNRQQIVLQVFDSTSSWAYSTNTLRPSNNNTANSLTIFSGLPEEPYNLQFSQQVSPGNAGNQIAIGFNSTTAATAYTTQTNSSDNSSRASIPAIFPAPPSLGINVITALESGLGGSASTFFGTRANMLLSAAWRG